MTENIRAVSIGEIVISKDSDDILVSYGLGSCVAICLYDPITKVGGMLHALLPSSPKENGRNTLPSKFVDQGIPLLVKSIESLGVSSKSMIVKLCGGAHMLSSPGFNDVLNIGKRNVAVATETLQRQGFQISAQDTGGTSGRTVKLYINDGLVTVKTLGQGEIHLG